MQNFNKTLKEELRKLNKYNVHVKNPEIHLIKNIKIWKN